MFIRAEILAYQRLERPFKCWKVKGPGPFNFFCGKSSSYNHIFWFHLTDKDHIIIRGLFHRPIAPQKNSVW